MVGGDKQVLQHTSRHIDSHRQSQPTQYCQLCLSILNFTTERLQDTASKWPHPECEDEENQTRPGSLPTKWQLSRSTHWDAGFGPWIWEILFPRQMTKSSPSIILHTSFIQEEDYFYLTSKWLASKTL